MSLFACASIHQGHECFSVHSRGKQCSFMSLSALLTAQTIPVTEWNSAVIDGILVQGDNMYLHSYNNNLIPREGLLSLNNLPTVIDANANYYAKSPVMTNICDLPIFIVLHFHHTTIALKKLGHHNSLTPITVGPICGRAH
jgi:hypothetical protein